jgi:uncharacterized membrane protein
MNPRAMLQIPKLPFWCIPILYSGGAVVFSVVFPRIEYRYLSWIEHDVSAAVGAAFFASVAQGMLALTGVVFALAFVMIQFASTAYSPRLVMWVSRDPVIWHCLGIFTATFVYSLAALIWVDRGGSRYVPFVSSWIVVALVVASLMALALLVQRLAMIQVSGVMRSVGDKGRRVVVQLYPSSIESTATCGPSSLAAPTTPVSQSVTYTGQPMAIASYDVRTLVMLARRAGGVIVMKRAVGDTLIDGERLLEVHGGTSQIRNADLFAAIRLAPERTFEQDLKYAIRILVDIAIKALSPAVNDPTTAVQAVDQIEDLLRRLGSRELAVGRASDRAGELRLIFPTPTWEDFLSLAFDEIRAYGAESVQVMRRVRAALSDLAEAVHPDRRSAVTQYIQHLEMTVRSSIADVEDQVKALRADRQGLGLSRPESR